ncbi:MAG: tellurite resistance TerB family protein [Pseudomonadota bacterium]
MGTWLRGSREFGRMRTTKWILRFMGLFSKLRNASPAQTPKLEAIAKAVITPSVFMIHADGKVQRSEADQLHNLCAFSPIFQELGAPGTKKAVDSVIMDIAAHGPQAVLSGAISQLSPLLRETALMFAMRIALADGELAEVERAVLLRMASEMGISPDNTAAMLEVVLILQRPASA